MHQFLWQKYVSHLVIEITAAGALAWKTVVGEVNIFSANFWSLVAALGALIIITTSLLIYSRRKLKSPADQP